MARRSRRRRRPRFSSLGVLLAGNGRADLLDGKRTPRRGASAVPGVGAGRLGLRRVLGGLSAEFSVARTDPRRALRGVLRLLRLRPEVVGACRSGCAPGVSSRRPGGMGFPNGAPRPDRSRSAWILRVSAGRQPTARLLATAAHDPESFCRMAAFRRPFLSPTPADRLSARALVAGIPAPGIASG
jgi:hypothetical protein